MQVTGTLGSLGAEITIATTSSELFAIDLTGDLKGRVEMQGSIDGVDFMPIQVKPYGMIDSRVFSHIIDSAGAFVGSTTGAVQVKAVVTKYESGSFAVVINAPEISSGGGGSSGGLTNAELRASPVPVSGPLTNAQLRATAVPVDGSGVTQPVSGPLTDAQLRNAPVPVSGPLTDAQLRASAVGVAPNVTRGGGVVDSNTQRVTLASDGPGVQNLQSIATATSALVSKTPDLVDGKQPVLAQNVITKFREAFEVYTPGANWTQTINGGDIIAVDGNAAAASYLVISKDPLTAGTSTLSSVTTFEMPVDLRIGLSRSQATLGQEFSVELVSTESPLATPSDIQISSIQQATTTLTVTTATAHGLKVGQRIGIRDVSDSRLNYSALVVATTPSATQFTATAGPGGAIPSVTAGPFANGFVFYRSALGYAPNGASQIFENATITNASFYVRSEAGDVLPSGTINGNHSITVATTASVQAINAALNYAFQPTSEFSLTAFVDGLQFSDAPVDTTSAATNRVRRTQVVPDHSVLYRVRFRATNNASLTRPVAQIVSVAKTGTTTATVTTDVAHGLTTGDYVNTYGVRDQTNFANLTAATVVASVVNATTFTVVWGSAVTATSYGGYVARVNGGNLMSALGALTMSGQSISRTNNIVTLVGSAAWSGALIGDYVNLVGVRDNSTGASLGLDGPYRIRDIQTTSLFLEPIGSAPTGTDITSTNCGCGVIKRTDLRISFVRVLDFERQRVEIMPRPASDAANGIPVNVQNSPAMTVSSGTITTVTTVSTLAAISAGANLIGDAGLQVRAAATGGSTPNKINSTAGTNATVLKAGAGKFYGGWLRNTTASDVYIKFHNASTTPTAGAAIYFPVPIPASGFVNLDHLYGIGFTTGIAYTIVTGAADSDATAVTAGAVVGTILTA